MGRGIRFGLSVCSVCDAAHEEAGKLCNDCGDLLERGDRDALKARSLAHISSRFGPFVKKDPELIAASIERRFGT